MVASDVRGVSTSAPPRRIRGRVSGAHVLMVFAALAAGLANVAVLRADDAGSPVLVAATDLAPGQTLTAELVREVIVSASAPTLGAFLLPADLHRLGTPVLTTAVTAGTPLRDTDVAPVAAPDGQRRMSIPLDRARAVGGDLAVGDHVDVIRSVDGRASYVAADLVVLDVSDGGDQALGGLAGFSITVAVDPTTALCLAAAGPDELTVVASTGAEPVDVGPCLTVEGDR